MDVSCVEEVELSPLQVAKRGGDRRGCIRLGATGSTQESEQWERPQDHGVVNLRIVTMQAGCLRP
jgi:hypothetical protein